MEILDYLSCLAARCLICFLNLLPIRARERICEALTRLVLLAIPRYKKIALRNLGQVFPDKSAEEIHALLDKSIKSLAHFIVDSIRQHTLDRDWALKHVSYPSPHPFDTLKKKYPDRGIIVATGHLGSFELFGAATALYGHPLNFIVRNFKGKHLDRWWTSMRERNGNKVIARSGAFAEVVHEILRGRNTAILFDQNVKRNHAVFVDFFGRPAATTRALALAALRTKAPVLVSFMQYTGNDNYVVHAKICDFDALYEDESKQSDEKVFEITQRVSKIFEKMILISPHEWFWMHRRWKTAPLGQPEDFY